jgi:Ca-activated chloride channel family protein
MSGMTVLVMLASVVWAGIVAADRPRCLESLGETVTLAEIGTGALVYRTADPDRFVPAPALDMNVEIDVRGVVATGRVAQRFSNPTDEWLEGVYVFPLPEDAAVHGLRLVIGERVIEGRIEEREQAKQSYETAKNEGRKASLVEQGRPNVFTTSVANIGPGETVEVRIEYHQTVRWEAGRFELRFPLVVGARYSPGAVSGGPPSGSGWGFDTDRVADASRITPPVVPAGHAPVNPVRIRVDLDPGFELDRLLCPYHAVTIERSDGDQRRVELDGEPVPADRDFVLEWAPRAEDGPTTAVFTEEHDGAFYVLAMVMPPAVGSADSVRLPRETVFVIDTSGSMGGASIVQARDALLWALERLRPEDVFNVIAFDSDFRSLFADSRPAVPSELEQARSWVGRLDAGGGTNMRPALERALHDPVEHTPLRQVVFITDGCVGNEAELFEVVENRLDRSRLFTVGIGSAPNSHFMQRAAVFGRGSYTHIGAPSEVADRMRELFTKIDTPVMADVEMFWPDATVDAVPERVPDLYAGEPVVVTARLGTLAGGLILSGVRANTSWDARVPLAVGRGEAGIRRLWARRTIASVMDDRTRGTQEDDVRRRVLDVALAHQLVSKYTSLVAVDVTPTRPPGSDLLSGAVRANLPAGWRHDTTSGPLPRGGTAAPLHRRIALALAVAAAVVWWLARRIT